MKSVFGYFLYIKSNWRIGDSCLARSRITAVPCFASWTLSNRKNTPASAHSRNSFKMYFVHWELLIKSYPCKIKNRITNVIRFFMVEDRRLYRIIAPHYALVHSICLRKLTFTMLRVTSAFRSLRSLQPTQNPLRPV